MDKTFNELFDEFFKKQNEVNNIIGDIKEETKRIIDILAKIQDSTSIDEAIEFELDKTLGKPDKIEFYNENGLYYEKRIWHTPNGDMVKLIVTDDPTLIIAPPEPKTLKQQLDEAIESEDYEKAAIIRDKIENSSK